MQEEKDQKKKNTRHPWRENGKTNWRNVFRPDWGSLFWVVLLLYLAWAYKHDISACQEVIDDPAAFCSDWCLYEDRQKQIGGCFPGEDCDVTEIYDGGFFDITNEE